MFSLGWIYYCQICDTYFDLVSVRLPRFETLYSVFLGFGDPILIRDDCEIIEATERKRFAKKPTAFQ